MGTEPTTTAGDEGNHQIPTAIGATEVPAASDARDKLLAPIGAEARSVVERSPGQTSMALAELARAYALVANGTSAVFTPAIRRQWLREDGDTRLKRRNGTLRSRFGGIGAGDWFLGRSPRGVPELRRSAGSPVLTGRRQP